MPKPKADSGAHVPLSSEDGVVRFLTSRQTAQIERVEVQCRKLTIWWEMRRGVGDLTDAEVDSIVEEFRKTINRKKEQHDDLQDS